MILKPSEIAPIDAMILAEVLDEAGVPAGVFNLINGDGPTVGEAMSAVSSSIMVRSKTCLPYAVRGDNARKRAVGAATSYMFAPVLTAQKSSVVNDRMTKTMYGGKLNLY